MNVLLESEFSLYQVVQQIQPSLQPTIVSAPTLKFTIGSLLNILTEQQLKTEIWVKLPQTSNWLDEITNYKYRGNAEIIYLCNSNKEDSDLSCQDEIDRENFSQKTPVIPIELKTNNTLQKESFLIVKSHAFCFSIIAQWQTSKIQIEASSKRLQQPYLKVFFNFDTKITINVLEALHNAIQPESFSLLKTKNKSQKSLLDSTSFSLNTSEENQVLVGLLMAQIQYIEKNQGSFKSDRADDSIVHFKDNKTFGNEFLSNLVRELRSPLTQMKTALSLLESKQLKTDRRQHYLQLINRECDRQNSLISGLLELMELDSASASEIPVSVKLEDLVPGIVSTYQPLAEEKGIQLGYTIPTGFPPIACPPGWLRQIIINLLNNSLQFTSSGGKVFVQASLRDDNIELIVTDTGVGIEMKDLSKIFNSFYRGRTAINEKINGAGLGLTIVQQLIRRCGGSINANSKVGKGSSFRVILPVIPMELQ
jgi:two-component system, OmpR family, phosphate regulon sensor histidine kinase PhoR